MVERALEVFDAFGLEREEDMYRWYAIVAAHLAEHYPKAFESQERQELLRQNHFSWARQIALAESQVRTHHSPAQGFIICCPCPLPDKT